jgi:hypothetical protein
VPTTDAERLTMATGAAAWTAHGERVGRTRPDGSTAKPSDIYSTFGNHATLPHDAGRWPPNVVLDDPEAAELDRQAGGVTGGASRFFPIFRYEAKAPPSQRPRVNGTFHPTVKPLDLMRWLVRLVTPPGGTVLDPFGGSGTTAEACIIEGARCITIERESDYLPLIQARITKPIQPALDLFGDDGPRAFDAWLAVYELGCRDGHARGYAAAEAEFAARHRAAHAAVQHIARQPGYLELCERRGEPDRALAHRNLLAERGIT